MIPKMNVVFFGAGAIILFMPLIYLKILTSNNESYIEKVESLSRKKSIEEGKELLKIEENIV